MNNISFYPLEMTIKATFF